MGEIKKVCPKCHFTMEEGKNTLGLLPMVTAPGGKMVVAPNGGEGLAVAVFCCRNCKLIEMYSFDISL